MDQRRKLSARVWVRMQSAVVGEAGRIATRYVDFLLIPWLLEGTVLYAYILARITSLIIPLALHGVSARVKPQLSALLQTGNFCRFQAAAARVNLGYLMVCGGMSLIVATCAPHWAALLGNFDPVFTNILVWAVVGQSAPILFGATVLLMNAVGRGAMNELLYGFVAALFVASVLIGNKGSAILIMQTFAVAQLTHAAICSISLARCGVWPGLTALFHKEIKLF